MCIWVPMVVCQCVLAYTYICPTVYVSIRLYLSVRVDVCMFFRVYLYVCIDDSVCVCSVIIESWKCSPV